MVNPMTAWTPSAPFPFQAYFRQLPSLGPARTTHFHHINTVDTMGIIHNQDMDQAGDDLPGGAYA